MRTRLLIHYLDGKTFSGDMDCRHDFKELSKKPISSLQIQEEAGKMHTLSSKNKKSNTFWQRDYIKSGNIISRSILKKLKKDIWLDMNIDCNNGKREITVIRETIKVK